MNRLVLAGAANDMPAILDDLCTRLANYDPAAYARAVKAVRPGGAFQRCSPFEAYHDHREQAFLDRNMFPDARIARVVEEEDSTDGLGNTGETMGALLGKGLTRYRFVQFAKVGMPVLLIAGQLDFETPVEEHQALARDLPQATLLIYPGSGHFMFVEQPARFGRDVSDFLAGQ